MIGKSDIMSDLVDCEIDTVALFQLAAPDVPQDFRDSVLTAAKDGTHITLEEAERMAAKRVAEVELAEREGRRMASAVLLAWRSRVSTSAITSQVMWELR